MQTSAAKRSRRPLRGRGVSLSALALLWALLPACSAGEGGRGGAWGGWMDTTAAGVVHVHSPADPAWSPDEAWRVTEELRLGSASTDGPELFGRVVALEVGPDGRLYVFDGQAQELRIFSADGRHLRTVGGEGGGPGEFRGVAALRWSPSGELWVVDPQAGQISFLDRDGAYLGSRPAPGGFAVFPWEGGFDARGGFWDYAFRVEPEGPRFFLVRFDEAGEPLDTLVPPSFHGERAAFEHRGDGGTLRAGVPFMPGLAWRRAPEGGIWAALTGEYTLFRLDPSGDTVRVLHRAFEPLPVTDEDVEDAVRGLRWFTDQGGRIDRGRIPEVKPALETFFLDDAGRPWVVPVTDPEEQGRVLDVFGTEGRYLGSVRLPFRLLSFPTPVFRAGGIHGVTSDELGVQYVVVGRIRG